MKKKTHCDTEIKELKIQMDAFQTNIQKLLTEVSIVFSRCVICSKEAECFDLPCQHPVCHQCHERNMIQCPVCPFVPVHDEEMV